MSYCHITRIIQIFNLEIGCRMLYRVQNRQNCRRYIGSMPIYKRFWVKNAISVWMCQIIAARCRKRNIGAISGLYRGYLEHCSLITMKLDKVRHTLIITVTYNLLIAKTEWQWRQPYCWIDSMASGTRDNHCFETWGISRLQLDMQLYSSKYTLEMAFGLKFSYEDHGAWLIMVNQKDAMMTWYQKIWKCEVNISNISTGT